MLAARCGDKITIHGYDEYKLKGDGSKCCNHEGKKDCKTCEYTDTVGHRHQAGTTKPDTHKENRRSGMSAMPGNPHGKRHGSMTARPASTASHMTAPGQPAW